MTEKLPAASLMAPGDPLPMPAGPLVRRVSFCPMCRAHVPVPGVPCKECAPAYIRQTREGLLTPAKSSLPRLFERARFDGPELAAWVKRHGAIAEAIGAIDAPWVVIEGSAGRGKTSLACAMASAVLDAALEADCSAEAWRRAQGMRFVPAYELSRAAAQHPLGEGQAPVVRLALESSLLILDDLGAEPRIHNSCIPDVIYARHTMPELQTVITTGFLEEVLRERYGAGIVRRVFECAVRISVGWDD